MRNGYNSVYGLEVNQEKIEKGRNEYPEIAENLIFYSGEVIPYDDNDFDVILMFDVIEHIPDVESFFKKQVYRVLKNSGQLIFQTPNQIVNAPWEIINNKSLSRWKQYHCSLQTKKTLRSLLKRSGFKGIVIEKNNINTVHNQRKVHAKLGYMGLLILHILQKMPLSLYPNLWGSAKK